MIAQEDPQNQFQDFNPGDIPAGAAPFEFVAEGFVDAALLAIADAIKPDSVSWNSHNGCFDIVLSSKHNKFALHPWMLNSNLDRDEVLADFPPDLRDAAEQIFSLVWQRMISELENAVALDNAVVVAREASPLVRSITVLPTGAWSTFQIEDWDKGIARCHVTGIYLFDVRFRRVKSCNLIETRTVKHNLSKAEIRRQLIAYRQELAPRIPTEAEEMRAVKAPRQLIRDIRAELAPPGGYKTGPKGPRNRK